MAHIGQSHITMKARFPFLTSQIRAALQFVVIFDATASAIEPWRTYPAEHFLLAFLLDAAALLAHYFQF
jgi:hypothetical protein